nr:hypothetical protein [Tanacetum cinerariifolium]
MEFYMENRENGRMILDSVQNGPLVWPTVVQEDGTTRKKTHAELSATEKLQADCDCKATNIVLQGLPPDVLPLEWSKFVTDVKLARDLHTTNYDQLYSYLEQHEIHANETRLMRGRYQDPLAYVANYHQSPSQLKNYHSQYNPTQFPQQTYMVPQVHSPQPYSPMYPSPHLSQPQINHSSVLPSQQYQSHQTSSVPPIAYNSPQYLTQPLTEIPQMDSGLAVPVFNQGDDPIACLNKEMAFLTPVASSRFPSTNNQLLTSSNPRNHATIQDDRVTVQQVQGRQGQSYASTGYTGEGHLARQCTQPTAWLKKKAMLAKAHEAGQILDEEQLAFLADPGIPDDVISEVHHFKPNHTDLDNQTQLQAKDNTICKLKEHIKSMRENDKEEKVKQDMGEIETINIELEHSVAKLLFENECLHKEIKHLKMIYIDQFDSIKKTCALCKEHSDSLIAQLNSKSMENVDLKRQIQDKVFVITSLKNDLRKLKGKEIIENAAQLPIATSIAPGMFKIDLDPLAPRLLKNREARIDYLKHTQEQADILQGIVKQAKAK